MALCGLCEVVFDVDQGNQVEALYPPGAFSKEECRWGACLGACSACWLAGPLLPSRHQPPSRAPRPCSDIAFSAFPDSMSMELSSRSSVRDSSFCFRLRRRAPPPGAPPHPFLYG